MWWSLAVLAGLFAAAQLKPVVRTNPESDPSGSLWARTQVAPEITDVLRRACADCHSNHTRWPWYSRVAPVSWFVTEHVNHGRLHLNFSDWVTISPHTGTTPEGRLELICKEVAGGSMPLRSYKWLHPEARLTGEKVRLICEWCQAERRRILTSDRIGLSHPDVAGQWSRATALVRQKYARGLPTDLGELGQGQCGGREAPGFEMRGARLG